MTTGVPSTLLTGGGWVLLDTKTASNSATLDFTSLITSSYDTYMFVLQDIIPSTDSVDLRMRTSTNNGSSYDSGASDYTQAGGGSIDGSSAFQPISASANAHIFLAVSVGNAPGESYSGTVTLFNPLGTATHRLGKFESAFVNSTPNLASYFGTFRRATNADIDAVRFYFAAGSIYSGVIRLYALKKA